MYTLSKIKNIVIIKGITFYLKYKFFIDITARITNGTGPAASVKVQWFDDEGILLRALYELLHRQVIVTVAVHLIEYGSRLLLWVILGKSTGEIAFVQSLKIVKKLLVIDFP